MVMPPSRKPVLTLFKNLKATCEHELRRNEDIERMLNGFSANLACDVEIVDISVPKGLTAFEDATEGDAVRTPMFVFSRDGKFYHYGTDSDIFRKWLKEHGLWTEACAIAS